MVVSNGSADGAIPRRRRRCEPIAVYWLPRVYRRLPSIAMLTAGIVLLSVGISCTIRFPYWATGFGAVPLFVTIVIGGRLIAVSAHALLNGDRPQP